MIYADVEKEPALGWDAVHAFEAEQGGVTLPEPYRSFVATITRGGRTCGPPAYGLMPPGINPHDWPDFRHIQLEQPFPLTETWVWEDDDDAWSDGVTPEDVYTRGGLPLGTDGNGLFWVLIVTGQHRAHIWSIADVGAQPFGREFGYTTGASGFLGWVAHWHSGAWWWDASPADSRLA
jgi:hypothetical protein